MRNSIRNKAGVFSLAVLGLGFTLSAWAEDGPVLINQTLALAGNVTPGDAPDFPVTLSLPGSYRLSGNLSVSSPKQTVISITADDVTLDLNGFRIQGPTVCSGDTGSALVCSFTGPGIGVSGPAPLRHIAVLNGTITGMGAQGISLGFDSRIEHVLVTSNGSHGMSLQTRSTVSDNILERNGGVGIFTLDVGNVHGNTASLNRSVGIFVGRGGTLEGNSATSNGSSGIVANYATVRGNSATFNAGVGISAQRSTVLDNTSNFNTGFGLVLPNSGYANNVVSGNNGDDAKAQVSGGIQIGGNLCGNDNVCP